MTVPALLEWDRDELGRRRDELLDVYAEAMQVSASAARARRPIVSAHLDRPGLRAVGGTDDDGRLVGVAYGYLGAPGQWWHDQVAAALTPSIVDSWLTGAFEVCELHVRPAAQGQGLGRALLEQLLTGPPAATAVLTTPDRETRARGFYRDAGWVDLLRGLMFPGDPRAFAVLGKRLLP
ncbi:MAG: GNAT family N-acetyltransferase [Frankiaceae bacterium]|nr:GNAT family N-acetyltransferase [Frankiaceae bacterium]